MYLCFYNNYFLMEKAKKSKTNCKYHPEPLSNKRCTLADCFQPHFGCYECM